MTAKRSEFQELLDEAVPGMVEAALAYVDGDPRVTDVWILATFEDNVSAYTAVYRVDGELVPLTEATELLGDPDSTTSAIGDAVKQLFYSVDDSELPNSMLVHYVVKSEEMDAQFSDERLPRQEGEPDSDYVLRWAKEFRG